MEDIKQFQFRTFVVDIIIIEQFKKILKIERKKLNIYKFKIWFKQTSTAEYNGNIVLNGS